MFRHCPACNASVLEDDAEVCPFCGASMTTGEQVAEAQPEKKPQAAPQQPAEPAGSGAPTKKTKTAKRPAAPPADDNADPFDVSTTASRDAIPASRKPTKGRMLRVVCPMCETPGFIPKKAAGQDVKCANPDCMMPVFTAPEPEEKEPEPEPTKSGLSMTVFGLVFLVVVAAAGYGAYVLISEEESDGDQEMIPLIGGPIDGTTEDLEVPVTDGDPEETVDVPQVSIDEIRSSVFDEIVDVAQENRGNRSKPFGRRMAAETFAATGQLEQAREQVDRLRAVSTETGFYSVGPLLLIAAQHRQAGRAEEATAALDEAVKAAEAFPKVGLVTLDLATELATALAINDRLDEATALIREHHDSGMRGRLSAIVQGARDLQTFDVTGSPISRHFVDLPQPQWVAVTRALAGAGQHDTAIEWANAAPSQDVRADSLAAWAAEATNGQTAAIPDPVQQALEGQSDVVRARMLAAVAFTHIDQQRREQAAEAVAQARQAFESVEVPEPIETPGLVQLYRLAEDPRGGLPDAAAPRSALSAGLEVAHVTYLLGEADAAWQLVERSLQFPKAMAPSSVTTAELVRQTDRSRSTLEAELEEGLELRSRDEARRAFREYRRQVDGWHQAAQRRFDLQVDALKRAVEWGLRDQVWEYAQQQSNAADPEPYLQSEVPSVLTAHYRNAGEQDKLQAIAEAVRQPGISRDTELRLALERLRSTGDMDRMHGALKDIGNRYLRTQLALETATRLFRDGDLENTFTFISGLNDPLTREDAFNLIAALAVVEDRASDFWRVLRVRDLSPTEQAAAFRGLIAGMQATSG